MRVALFFDGKNHTKDQRRAATDRWVDHGALAKFAVEHVGGTEMAFAWYYTGVPSEDVREEGTSFVTVRRGRANHEDDAPTSTSLSSLLDELERKPGFFVKRFPRRPASRECPVCGQASAYTEEKMVDTSLVADLVLQAARGTFDVAVVFSGDVDIAPGIQAVHDLGRRCWVATYGTASLSRQLTRVAWGTVDLLSHLDAFSSPDLVAPRAAPVARPQVREPAEVAPPVVETSGTLDEQAVDVDVLRELRRAIAHFGLGGGFVGGHYFVHRWKGKDIPESPELRRASLQRLMSAGLVDTYTVDGKSALRVIAADGVAEEPASLDGPGVTASVMQLGEPLLRRGADRS